jgi:5-methylcytosine-specific restriction endonuclease McrA
MGVFEETHPSLESYWRAVILFGRNVASYKFALGKSLIELSAGGEQFFMLEDLAEPFTRNLIAHLKESPKQTTSQSSRFLDACRKFDKGEISKDRLIGETVRLGFNNVIDAFHIVNAGEIPVRFYTDRRNESRAGIELTDDFFRLKETLQFPSLPAEVESRWRLVETAWELQLPARMLLQYNPTTEMLVTVSRSPRRTDVTACRDALNGYQKGKCFYCFEDIAIDRRSVRLGDVDHFVPWVLMPQLPGANVDGVWNLVLACRDCNRGVDGKSSRLPVKELLERLHTRNEFYIASHHPLRETLIAQTGATLQERISFLSTIYREAQCALVGMTHSPSGGSERTSSCDPDPASIGTGSPTQPHLSQVGRSHSSPGKSVR